jgi:pilus assembly protein CpaF
MPREGVVAQLAAGLEAVIHLARRPDGRREVREVGVLTRDAAGAVLVVPALVADAGGLRAGPGHAVLLGRLGDVLTGGGP